MTESQLPESATWAKSIRDNYGLSIEQWAPLMGVKPATIRRWERSGHIDPVCGKMFVTYEIVRNHMPARNRIARIVRMGGDMPNLMLALLLETSDTT